MPANLENSAGATGLKKVSFIPIPKKGNAKECSNYCTIALISHVSTDKAMAPHSSTLAWKITWMEEPGRLQSMGSLESDTTERLSLSLWTFFGIAFLWDWNETDFFQSFGHCWIFQICWHIECSTFTASSHRIWNSSAGIPSPPLALFVVMLPKANLTSNSRMN